MAQTRSTSSFWNTLNRSGLLEPTLVRNYQDLPLDEASRKIVEDGLLTSFQLRQLLERRFKGFFIGDKYKILETLGRGGMGRVVLCEHLMLERLVAVKLMAASMGKHATAEDRFIREARAAAVLDHPHVGRIFDVDRSKDGLFMVMEYIDGSTLERLVLKHGKLAPEQTANYAYQISLGLEAIHQLGLIHRDIKPSNLMIDRKGKVKILDLGLVRFTEPERNQALTAELDANALVGSIDFVAPEQAVNCAKADIRSDIYSLGCSLYFLLTRTLPAGKGTTVQKLLRHHSNDPTPVHELDPNIPQGLSEVVSRMLKKNPAERYQTPSEITEALKPFSDGGLLLPDESKMPRPRIVGYRTGLKVSIPAHTERPSKSSSISMSSTKLGSDSNSIKGSSDATPSPTTVNSGNSTYPAESNLFAELGDLPILPVPVSTGYSVPPPSISPAIPTYKIISIAMGSVLGLVVLFFAGRSLLTSSQPSTPEITSLPLAPPEKKHVSGALVQSNSESIKTEAAIVVHGGGSTAIAPMMNHWISLYKKERDRVIQYESVGSSKGVDGLLSQKFDFGCTDAPLTDEQLASSGKGVIHIPLVMGAVVPTYNLVDAQGNAISLRFTGSLLANIYLGKTTRWNDASIAANNPGIQLPDLEITVVARSDGSGTTSIWTDYLSKSSAAWKNKVGTGNKVQWPKAITAEKNNGVADQVSRTNGSIGYVEMNYAMAHGITFGPVMNRDGSYVTASPETITKAAIGMLKEIPSDLRYSLTDAAGQEAYPITGTSWAIVRLEQLKATNRELLDFLNWICKEGQTHVPELNYGPIPPELRERIQRQFEESNQSSLHVN